MTLNNFVEEFNLLQNQARELNEEELYQQYRLVGLLFRNLYYEAPMFELDVYGKIKLLEVVNETV